MANVVYSPQKFGSAERHCLCSVMVWLRHRRIVRTAAVCAVLFSLSACMAGSGAYKRGNALLAAGELEQGLAWLEEALRRNPQSIQYRAALRSGRASAVNQLLARADVALRAYRFAEAEAAYRRILGLDAQQIQALDGLQRVARMERRRAIMEAVEGLFESGREEDLQQATDLLRGILRQDPDHNAARTWKARIDTALAAREPEQNVLAEIFSDPISLEFRDADLRSVLDVIAQVSGLNFFYDKDVPSQLKVTLFAKDTTIEDAMRLVLITNGLRHKVLNAHSILIYPNLPPKIEEYQSLVVRTFYLENADAATVAESIKTIVKSENIVVDERLGVLIVRDTADAIRMAERIVALQDLREPEVMLDVEILEIQRSRLQELGIRWPSQIAFAPLATGNTLNLRALLNLTDLTTQVTVGSATINAREESQGVNILANPRIRVRNKEMAKIQIGDRVPVITANITTSTTTAGVVSDSVSYVDVGLKLDVEPNIHLNGEVAIKISMEVSSLAREIITSSGTRVYQIGTRMASTVLRLKDGETQILAGLINDEDRSTANNVPSLRDLPLAGRLFGSQRDEGRRSEILLSITPRVVRTLRRPDLLDTRFDFGTARNIGTGHFQLSPPNGGLPREALPEASGGGSADHSGVGSDEASVGVDSAATGDELPEDEPVWQPGSSIFSGLKEDGPSPSHAQPEQDAAPPEGRE